MIETSVLKRFWKYVNKTIGSPCWLWTGAHSSFGHGHIKVEGKQISTHRLSWLIHRKEIPLGLCVLHRCDIPSCVRPSHLFLGTKGDNARDMEAKGRGRQPKGEKQRLNVHPDQRPVGTKNPKARLTDEQVLEIRRRYSAERADFAAIEKEAHISEAAVRQLISGRDWKQMRNARNLNDAQVLAIKKTFSGCWLNVAAMAREFQISEGAIRHILKGRHWKHLLVQSGTGREEK